MKNNGGWSLQLMLFFCSVLIFSLFLSASILGSNFKQSSSNPNGQEFSYSDLEVRLINSSKKYINAYYQEALTDSSDFTVVVSLNKLKEEGHLTKIINPKNQKECSGYVIFKKIDNYFHYDGYINCNPNYKTQGYKEEYENY